MQKSAHFGTTKQTGARKDESERNSDGDATRRELRLPELTIRLLEAVEALAEASISVATNQNFPPFSRRAARPAFQSVQPL